MKTNKKQTEVNRKKIAKAKKKMVGEKNIKGSYEEVEIGVVGVDSGSIVITDPCYIDSEWEKEELVQKPAIILFPNGATEQVISCSKRWFELVERINDGELKIIEDNGFDKAKNNFSYPACANQTLDKGYGQLNYKMGHAGVGVVTSSGYGDGCYPVIAKIEKESGRVKEIRVVFF
jgi:hypothetical protein